METPILKSASVQTLFDRHIRISHDPSDKSFSNSMLSEIHFDDVLAQIRRLPGGVALNRDIPIRNEKIEPGTVYVLDVDVGWEGNDVKVSERERNALKISSFFYDMNNATKVVWIRSESIRMVDAKLRVFQKYEGKLWPENILLYHDFDENKDEILKLSGRQKLDLLYEMTKSQRENVPDQSLHQILQNAANRALTQDKIRQLCESVDLHYKGDYVGKAGYSAYTCHSKFTVDEIKKDLVEKTLKETAVLFGTEICGGILQHIKPNIQGAVDQQFSMLKESISNELYPIIQIVVHHFFVRILIQLRDLIYAAVAIVFVLILSVNINSVNWRQSVADEIYTIILKNKRDIIEEILPQIKEICEVTRKDIDNVCKKIEKCKQKIDISDKEKEINEWKKREVIRNMMTFPSVVGYIAGTKDGKEAVKVFFDQDVEELEEKSGEKSKEKSSETVEKQLREKILEKFQRTTYFKNEPKVSLENVKNIIEKRSKMLKGNGKHTPVAPFIPGETRDNIDKIIQSEGERIITTYSNVMGLDIDRMLLENGQFGDPCIVLYCFDKTVVPFGEESLPTHLKGCPVDIREEFIMFGHCSSSCDPLKQGCSIGIPEEEKAGSVGFFVRSTVSLDKGFLTAAHVALKEIDIPISDSGFVVGTHKIVHPSSGDSKQNKIVGIVSRSVRKSIGPKDKETGVDVAYVKFDTQTPGDEIDLQTATDEDLPFDDEKAEILVIKTGRTTGETTGILKSASRVASTAHLGRLLIFKRCYYIKDDKNKQFFEPGDSGSAVFLKNGNKPLGIGFAYDLGGTYACRISEILKEFNVKIYKENAQEKFDVS